MKRTINEVYDNHGVDTDAYPSRKRRKKEPTRAANRTSLSENGTIHKKVYEPAEDFPSNLRGICLNKINGRYQATYYKNNNRTQYASKDWREVAQQLLDINTKDRGAPNPNEIGEHGYLIKIKTKKIKKQKIYMPAEDFPSNLRGVSFSKITGKYQAAYSKNKKLEQRASKDWREIAQWFLDKNTINKGAPNADELGRHGYLIKKSLLKKTSRKEYTSGFCQNSVY